MIPSGSEALDAVSAVYQRGLVIDSQLGYLWEAEDDSISKGIGD